jgi:3-dehydrosphinganine reductase
VKEFREKQVFVVGGSAGIGLSAAKLFAARGAHVAVFARRAPLLEAAAAEIEAARVESRQRVAGRTLDVARHDEASAALRAAADELGPPDVLLNCAGRAIPRRFEDIDFAQFDQTMKTNLYGTWTAVAALLPALRERRGYVVNVSSMVGFMGIFGYTDYAASKFGVIGFSEALRAELKPDGVRVSVLCPPDTDTPGFHEENKTKPPETVAISAGAKTLSADEVAQALLAGMARERFLIIPGRDGRLAHLAKRLVPGVVDWVLDASVKKVRRQQSRS